MQLTDEEVVSEIVRHFDADGSGDLDGEEIDCFLRMMLASIVTRVARQARPLTLIFARGSASTEELGSPSVSGIARKVVDAATKMAASKSKSAAGSRTPSGRIKSMTCSMVDLLNPGQLDRIALDAALAKERLLRAPIALAEEP
jgi:hypothetical protein